MPAIPGHQVFVSYSHDSEDHRAWVLKFVDRLRQDGIDAWIDIYEPAPSQGWPRWMAQQIEAARVVIVVCTDTYKRRFDGLEIAGTGNGVTWEGYHIAQVLYNGGARNEKFIPVVAPGATQNAIPVALAGYTHYSLPGGHEALCRHILGEPAVRPPPLGPVGPHSQGFSLEPEISASGLPGGATPRHAGPEFLRLQPFPGKPHPPDRARAELDIHAERVGDVLRLKFCVRNEAATIQEREAPGIAALLERVRRVHTFDGSAALVVGEALAACLFGRPGDDYHRLFRRVFGEVEDRAHRTGPLRGPVRCRLHLDDPELCALPWTLLAEDGSWFADAGWLVELAAVETAHNHAHIHLQAPCRTLFIVPEAAARHRDDLAAVLAGLWRPTVDEHLLVQYIWRASTWSKVQELAPQAEVVVVCTRASDAGGRWTLRLDGRRGGQEEVKLDAFMRALAGPKVLYLNVAAPRPLMPTLRGLAGPACVIAPWTPSGPDFGPEAESGARQWLRAFLGEGHDPVSALHVVTCEQASVRAGTMQALTRYRTWATSPAPTQRYTGRARLHVDRRHQRLRFWDILQTLARHETRRVEAIVSFGELAHGIDALPDLLEQHVEDTCNREAQPSLKLTRDRLILPQARHDLEASLHDIVCSALNIQTGGKVEGALALRFAEIKADRGARKVLWIDWGVLEEPPTRPELLAWLRYHTLKLGSQCPKDGRIVATLGITASDKGCARLAAFFEDGVPAEIARTPTASVTALPGLHHVQRSDLVDYLENHSSCLTGQISAVADALLEATGGVFEGLVARIEAVEHKQQTWDQLAGARAGRSYEFSDEEDFR